MHLLKLWSPLSAVYPVLTLFLQDWLNRLGEILLKDHFSETLGLDELLGCVADAQIWHCPVPIDMEPLDHQGRCRILLRVSEL